MSFPGSSHGARASRPLVSAAHGSCAAGASLFRATSKAPLCRGMLPGQVLGLAVLQGKVGGETRDYVGGV